MHDWTKIMQFKVRRHLVDCTKSDSAWDRWLQQMHGRTGLLLAYEDGLAITKGQDLQALTQACIVPAETDRAGATDESCLHEIVSILQEQWSQTFQAETAVWRMWANYLTRNLNLSTWDAAITQPPPDHISRLLRASDSHVQQHLTNVFHSANLNLDCVKESMADYQQLRED
ncbi:hypothetical protein GQ600_3632 [Phytophthora cactorum]|nr:hypothetical protein GQ600_3632 [Phytophthora cactorum]